MARFIFGLNQSLDGYVDHARIGPPEPAVFSHFIEHMRGVAGCVYGRRTYEIMRYWDEDRTDWDDLERDYAAAWRSRPKWVVSGTMSKVGPNATLIGENVEAMLHGLKGRLVGEIDVAGPEFARSLSDLGLLDEYRLYIHPVVLGQGTPFFAGLPPTLRLVTSDRIGRDVIRLIYVPA